MPSCLTPVDSTNDYPSHCPKVPPSVSGGVLLKIHYSLSLSPAVPFTEGLICACDGPDHNCYNGMCTSIASVCYTQFEVYPNSSFNITSHYCPSGPLGHCDITQNNSGVLTHRTCCSDNLCNICPDISKLSEFKAYYNLAVDSNCSSPTPPASPGKSLSRQQAQKYKCVKYVQ